MSLIDKANKIINTRSEEKERQYGPMTEGMISAMKIAEYINTDDELTSFRYMYGLKMSRQKYNHKEDNLLDAIAYRIAEINAIIEKQTLDKIKEINGTDTSNMSFPDRSLSTEQFNKLMDTINDIEYTDSSSIIMELTQLNLSGDDIYKIHLGIEMNKEQQFVKSGETEARVLSIVKQIKILDEMNTFNNKNEE